MKRIAGLLAALAIVGCGGPEPKPRTVNDLADDPAVLQGLLARCEADKRAKFNDVECDHARRALDRLGGVEDAKLHQERDAEFERQKMLRREHDEAQRRAAAQANPPFDPYSSPIATEASPPQPPPKP